MSNTLEKIIYSRRIAIALRQYGFPILRIEVNPYKPKYDCYIFQNTPELNQKLNFIIQNQEGERNGT